eukprot:CAMPEP_0114541650 /NCGR_PEP_ID=MMETSP0114-20121206/1416_1 /TAXON_ID=31324 /ORGANISM="Goniomonas sp, Strain m" /LENGTH=210 /DNA_ID=CAMNT_0001725897 /DNA_START=8 /DNA_END=640 /DNA_ORIENTATION=+
MAGHGHSHGPGACEHEHKEIDGDGVDDRWLFDCIDVARVRSLNADPDHVAAHCIKPFDQRTDVTKYCYSDCDEQLIIVIPFTGLMRLKSIVIVGGPGDECPSSVKLFANREDIDFDTAEDLPPLQTIELAPQQTVEMEYPLKISNFNNVHNLTLFFPGNFGAEFTRINYIGIKGIFKMVKTEAVAAIYELRPQPGDHKTKDQNAGFNSVS